MKSMFGATLSREIRKTLGVAYATPGSHMRPGVAYATPSFWTDLGTLEPPDVH